MTGVVQGGWEFVIAAYVVTALVFGGYAASVFTRWRAAKRVRARDVRAES